MLISEAGGRDNTVNCTCRDLLEQQTVEEASVATRLLPQLTTSLLWKLVLVMSQREA